MYHSKNAQTTDCTDVVMDRYWMIWMMMIGDVDSRGLIIFLVVGVGDINGAIYPIASLTVL